ncbi:ABC transporter substrate-binding protein, partial [Klebsiella pneumoniae]
MSAHAALDLRANEQPLPVTRDPQAIAKIPPGYRFVEPGTLTVAISALNSPPRGRRGRGPPPPVGGGPGIAPRQGGRRGRERRGGPTAG